MVWDSDSKLLGSVTCAFVLSLLHSGIILHRCNVPPNGRNEQNDRPPWARSPAKVKHPPSPAHFPLLRRGPWVTHTSLSLHSKPPSSGYKWSLLMLPCSTDTAWMGIKNPFTAISRPSLYPKHVVGFLPTSQAFIHFWEHSIYWERKKGKTVRITFGCFFQQINQTPLITQMIAIQLFAEWYTVLINFNLHCMSLEFKFLFLIRGNLAGGSDLINGSRFLYSGCVNLCGMTVAPVGPPYLAGALSLASWQGQAHGRAVISSHRRHN